METIGKFHPAGSPRFVRAFLGVWLAFGVLIVAFGAVGGPYAFDDPASWPHSAEDRVEAVASMRRLLCGSGAAMIVMCAFLAIVVGRIQAGAARLKPTGDAARDPFAWMCFITRLNGGRWIGPAASRPFAIQTIRRTLQITTPVDSFTRVSWSRRPPTGRAIDRAAGLVTEDGAPHGFPGLEVSMRDVAWARRLFAADATKGAVSALTGDEEVVLIVLGPKRLLFHLPYGSSGPIDDARMRRWVDAITRLARAIEANGPPAERLEPNALERMADRMLS